MTAPASVQISLRVPADELERLDTYADWRFNGNRTAAILHAVKRAAAGTGIGGARLEADTWAALRQAACRRLARQMTVDDINAALDVTNGWAVSAVDAALIGQELEDAGRSDVAARLASYGPADRATLTLACRWWWDQPEASRPEPAALLAAYAESLNRV